MQDVPRSARAATAMVRQVLTGVDGIREVHTDWCTNTLHTVAHLTGAADGDAVLAFLTGAFQDMKVTGHLDARFVSVGFPLPAA